MGLCGPYTSRRRSLPFFQIISRRLARRAVRHSVFDAADHVVVDILALGRQPWQRLPWRVIERPLGLRDRVMLETLYSTAMCCQELCRLAVYRAARRATEQPDALLDWVSWRNEVKQEGGSAVAPIEMRGLVPVLRYCKGVTRAGCLAATWERS